MYEEGLLPAIDALSAILYKIATGDFQLARVEKKFHRPVAMRHDSPFFEC